MVILIVTFGKSVQSYLYFLPLLTFTRPSYLGKSRLSLSFTRTIFLLTLQQSTGLEKTATDILEKEKNNLLV